MAETIDTPYSETDIADLRASGHWPAEDELDTTTEEELDTATKDELDTTTEEITKATGKRADTSSQPA